MPFQAQGYVGKQYWDPSNQKTVRVYVCFGYDLEEPDTFKAVVCSYNNERPYYEFGTLVNYPGVTNALVEVVEEAFTCYVEHKGFLDMESPNQVSVPRSRAN